MVIVEGLTSEQNKLIERYFQLVGYHQTDEVRVVVTKEPTETIEGDADKWMYLTVYQATCQGWDLPTRMVMGKNYLDERREVDYEALQELVEIGVMRAVRERNDRPGVTEYYEIIIDKFRQLRFDPVFYDAVYRHYA